MKTVCEEIKCPYFCKETDGYGCRRYSVALQCHLNRQSQSTEQEFQWGNQYALHATSEEMLRNSTAWWQSANNAFFKADEQYARDRAFQAEHAEMFEQTTAPGGKVYKPFLVGEIQD